MKQVKETSQTVELTTLSEFCRYCERVPWGNIRYIGLGQWTHEECSPGSRPWIEWYERQPKDKRTTAMEQLYRHYKRD